MYVAYSPASPFCPLSADECSAPHRFVSLACRLYERQVGAEAAEAEERACDVERYRDLETAMQEEEGA